MREPIGYFLLERGGVAGPLPDHYLTAPLVVGQVIRVPWSAVNPADGKYDWSEIDHRLAQCVRLNRVAQLLIQTGRDGLSPKWIGGQWITGEGTRAPAPWSHQLASAWAKMTKEAGKRYNAQTALVGVKASGPTWPSAEMHPCPNLAGKKGYSRGGMVRAWGDAIKVMGEAFTDVAVSLAISVKKPVDSFVAEVIANAHQLLGDRLRIQHNSLSANTHKTAPHHALVEDCYKLGVNVGFEMVTTVKDITRFGSRNVMDGINIGKLAGAKWLDIYPQLEDIRGLR